MANVFEQILEKETVFKDRNLITPHYTPRELPFREAQIKEISEILSGLINSLKVNNLFLYGKTGTGKTSTVRHVISDLLDYANKKDSKINAIYINCRNHSTKYRALLKCLKELYPNENFLGFSAGFVHEKLIDYIKENKNSVAVVLDEIDKLKELDDLVYALTRANDEFEKGSISVIGISNNLMFKDRLDPRTKSSLCEKEIVFSPYNAEELKEILIQRVKLAFKENTVSDSAINLASAIAAKESGDARTALMLLLRAGEISDKKEKKTVSEEEIFEAKKSVEEEIIFSMISTLPSQEQLVLLSIAELSLKKTGITNLSGEQEKGLMFSGEVYEKYQKLAKNLGENVVSTRWYRQYISELEMYGLIHTTNSGPGQRGQTRLIKLGFDAEKIKNVLEKELNWFFFISYLRKIKHGRD